MNKQILTDGTNEDGATLAGWLECDDLEVRTMAEAAVFGEGADKVARLVALVEQENRKKPRRFAMAFGVGILALVVISALISIAFHVGIGGAIGGMSFSILLAAASFAPTPLQKRAVKVLSEVDDIRAVGPLLEALDKQDQASMKAAGAALIRLLPRLKPADGLQLTENQRRIMYRALFAVGTGNPSPALVGALLAAIEQVGDSKALPNVAKLSRGKGAAKRDAQLQARAADIVPLLERREEEEHARDLLLRPAADADADALLRPAGDSCTDDALLLRPTAPQ